MTRHDDLILLGDMLDAAREASAFGTVEKARFDADRVLQLALTRLVQNIGEAASRVSAPRRAMLPRIPWVDIIGTRNRLVHDYGNVDMNVIWSIVTERLSPLIEALEAVVPADDDPADESADQSGGDHDR